MVGGKRRQRPENAGYVDGVDTSFAKQGGGSRIFMPTTSLTETRLETAGFSAEYGRVVAGVTSSVIKSGTNQFHGDFLYIPQNEKWRAPYEELSIPRDDDIIDSYETSLGGPIVRDKAWFFGSYGKMDSNRADVVEQRHPLNVGFQTTASILKLNFQPTAKHHIPAFRRRRSDGGGQHQPELRRQWTPCDCALDEETRYGTWSYAITDSASSRPRWRRGRTTPSAIRCEKRNSPGGEPESPAGNSFRYRIRRGSLVFHSLGGERERGLHHQQAETRRTRPSTCSRAATISSSVRTTGT